MTSSTISMELQLLGLLLSFLLFAAALRKLWRPRFRGAERSSRNLQQAAEEAKKLALPLPPGSLGFPIIGETLELLRLQRRGLPWSFFHHRISRYGETFKTNLLGSPSVVLASPRGNKTAFSSIYVSWPSSVISVIGTHALIAKVGPEAARIRIALMAFLQPESLRKYTAIVDRLLFAFIRKHLHGKPDVVLFPFMKELAFSIACHVLTGRDDVKDHATLLAPFNTMLKGLFEIPVNIPGTRYRKALAASKEIRKKLQVWIDERRRDLDAGSVVHHGDSLTGLVEYRDAEGHPFSDDEIKDNIIGLLFAAHDSSASVATITCKYLASNPDIMDEVYRENKKIAADKRPDDPFLNWGDIQNMKLSWRVIQESMRLTPPAELLFRVVPQDMEFGGFRIPKSWKILWSPSSTHRNPKYFPEPDKFDPSRFEGAGPAPFTFVPFGGGPRMCLGQEFARMETLMILHRLITAFSWTLDDPNETIVVDPFPVPSKGLRILLHPRAASS